jgi:hypothetical protein
MHSAVALPDGTKFGQARVRLARAQKKYPEIMNNIFLTNEEPMMARYGEPGEEEMIIVDIDLDPTRAIPEPTAEQKAISDALTPYKKPR